MFCRKIMMICKKIGTSYKELVSDYVHERWMLWELAKNDFKARFANTFLGVVWAFITPLVTMLVFWYVFQLGLRNNNINDMPFIVWYAPAFLIWTFFSETWVAETNCIREYSYLVRKVDFRISIIPAIKVISGSIVHIAFILFIIVLNMIYGIWPSVYYLQVFYYFFCTIMMVESLGILCSCLTPFVGDVPSLVGVATQILFWATPIVWNPDNMGDAVKNILKLNPMYYICSGYRDTFIGSVWFWDRSYLTLYFWGFVIVTNIIGVTLFNRVKNQFVDVL